MGEPMVVIRFGAKVWRWVGERWVTSKLELWK